MLRRIMAVMLATVLCAAFSINAFAQDSAQEKKEAAEYAGVTPNGGDPPTIKQPPPGLQYVTWPGFKVKKTGIEVFLQMTGPVKYKTRKKGSRIYITLHDTQVYLRNNFRPVLTQHFPGPVKSFRVRQLKGDNLRLDISLKKRAKPKISLKTLGQYTYLIVFFPNR